MTPEQKQLVRYAEAMGWKQIERPMSNHVQPYSGMRMLAGDFIVIGGQVWVCRQVACMPLCWNPATDANDAVELAKKMKVAFQYRPNDVVNQQYAAWRDPLEYCMPTLPAAICAAVDAAPERNV